MVFKNNLISLIQFDYLKKLLTKAKVIGGDEVVPELQKLLTADVVEKITVDIKKNYIVTHISNKKIPLDFSKLNDAITKIKAIAGEIFVALLTYGPDSSIPLTENKNISTITTIDPTDHVRATIITKRVLYLLSYVHMY